MQHSIAASPGYTNGGWDSISSMSNSASASACQSSDTSSYRSFSETLSGFQTQNEKDTQNEPDSEIASSSLATLDPQPNSSAFVSAKLTVNSLDLEKLALNNAGNLDCADSKSSTEPNPVIEPNVGANLKATSHAYRSVSVSVKSKATRMVRTDDGVSPSDVQGDSYVSASDQRAMASQNSQGAGPESSPLKLPDAKALSSPISLDIETKAKSKNASGDLAFAVKVEPKTTNNSSAVAPDPSSSQPDSSEPSVPNAYSSGLKSLFTQKGDAAHRETGGPASLPIVTAASQTTLMRPGGQATVSKGDAPTPTEQIPDTATNTQLLLKTVQIRVTGENNQQVDLRLMESSGTLSVSVRSADTTLTRALQQSLPDLSSKLNDQQIRAEWWTPQAMKVASATKSDDAPGDFSGGNSATQDQNGQNNDSRGRQGGRGASQPDWVEELSALRNSNQNGKNLTWHL